MIEFVGKLGEYLGFPIAASEHALEIDHMNGWIHWLMIILFVGWGIFFIVTLVKFGIMKDDSTRKMKRDVIANKKPLYVLESELFELQQKSKHNKDTRNRMKKLSEVITVKRYAAEKVNTLIQKELEDKKKYVDLPE